MAKVIRKTCSIEFNVPDLTPELANLIKEGEDVVTPFWVATWHPSVPDLTLYVNLFDHPGDGYSDDEVADMSSELTDLVKREYGVNIY